MSMHPGLQKYFSNLSRAAKVVGARQEGKEKLRSYINKIKIVSSQTAKKSVISSEIQKLEKHLEEMLNKKLGISKNEKISSSALKEKEEILDAKIAKMNELLAKVGKKVDEQEFKEQLMTEEEQPKPVVEELEDKLYTLESKYFNLREDPLINNDLLVNIQDKIAALKEKIRELKSR